ncbi:MAG TPA: aminotransferase class V-fold PLP-dependent enzyme [Streptosporangiaceae bacterium]|nr:aminotransferase class V-fold PLP-dependent enzyme [Streptosporangiaceae bacterium]
MGANAIWGDDWDEVRRLWLLDPEVAHCNHGSFGAVPAPVLAAQDKIRRQMAINPMRWFARELPDLVAVARAEVAAFLGAEADDLAFVSNVSAGVSAVTQSLQLSPGDEVLSSDHGYGAVSYALDRLCARTGARRVVASIPYQSSDDEVVAAFAERCTERTRFVVADQVTSATARRFPVEEVALLAHRAGARVLVDGAHAPGMLALNVPRLGADFWVGNLHKWACTPAGTGALWVDPQWRQEIRSLVVSWSEPDGYPRSFDTVGTNDLSAWLAAPDALRLLGSLGWGRVRAHNEALVSWAHSTVAEILGLPTSDLRHDPGLSMALLFLPPGTADSLEQAYKLRDQMAAIGVEMAMGCWNGRGTVRLSAQVYNQPADYERLATGLRDLMAG